MDIKSTSISISSEQESLLVDIGTDALLQNYSSTEQYQESCSNSTTKGDVGLILAADLSKTVPSSVQYLAAPACCYDIDERFSIQHSAAAACWYNTDISFFKHLIAAGLKINDNIPSSTIIEMKPHFALTYDEEGKIISESKQSSHYPDMTILHLASGIGNCKIVRIILEEANVDVNTTDPHGNTPLHYCAMAKYYARDILSDHGKCACLLLNKGGVDLTEKENGNLLTPYEVAAQSKNLSVLRIILQHGKSAKRLIPTGNNKYGIVLEKLAECKPWEIKNESVIAECTELLLHWYNVNPNNKVTGSGTFITLAAKSSNISVLKVIMKHEKTNKNKTENYHNNLLHYTVDKFVGTPQYIEKTVECLDYLIDECKIDINFKNKDTFTPLVLALERKNQHIALHLLKRKACINDFKCDGGKLLNLFHPNTLTSYFNECIEEDEEGEYYRVCFHFDFLKKCKACSSSDDGIKTDTAKVTNAYDEVNEMNFVSYLAKKDHMKHLLANPLILCFLCLKYYKTSIFRWVMTNTLIYLVYLIALNTYVSAIVLRNEKLGTFLQPIIAITVMYIGCKEVMQMLIEKAKYLLNFGNWIEMPLLTTTIILLIIPMDSLSEKTELLVFTVFLSWFMCVLVTGRLPFFSVQFEMLLTVMHTFFHYMLWYCIIIIGYAMCFFILFHNESPEKNENNSESVKASNEQSNIETNQIFNYLWLSVERSLVMMTGELNYTDFTPVSLSILSHLVLISFVLIIAIVLLNLLQGLAVYDTQAIIQEATILSAIARIQEIERFEKLLKDLCSIFPRCTVIRNICNTALAPRLIRTTIECVSDIKYNIRIYRNVNVSTLASLISAVCHYFVCTDDVYLCQLIDSSLNESAHKLISELLTEKRMKKHQQYEAKNLKEFKEHVENISNRVLLNYKELQELKSSLHHT